MRTRSPFSEATQRIKAPKEPLPLATHQNKKKWPHGHFLFPYFKTLTLPKFFPANPIFTSSKAQSDAASCFGERIIIL